MKLNRTKKMCRFLGHHVYRASVISRETNGNLCSQIARTAGQWSSAVYTTTCNAYNNVWWKKIDRNSSYKINIIL